uniref:Major facilitator superfamily (MFS) profile domain-containing protein n=1 Tax=Leptocylindrus danicus TaxID=163516 RepID=A0A7S2K3I8_9STRA|mmetsp:Transcript_16236/g.23913  ORF Transcript_16236/g.23913 Transcript_16236/m.23913 type:complete len:460 (+) Transcript_16236:191-1570(+)|eukprot:CAMPEP_0116013062 /NCGR_PEP_ID=MMETSP0321-20121206/5502_1 /TAXON_ID=163516 /ORGANISM="Leptocylindrus danicus var. danicus, Strain B650" /LENGTH=459 /DNA_ID=CAMNT_0003482539 /DNA_START=171 /DNA_END=1550 /DNA_ORIENTATION=+
MTEMATGVAPPAPVELVAKEATIEIQDTVAVVDSSVEENDVEKEIKLSASSSNSKKSRDLLRLAFGYTCAFSCVTLAVGAMPLVFTSTGGSDSASPLTLAFFFLGSSFISLVTSKIFLKLGRRTGFIIGNSLGILGGILGALAVYFQLPALVVVASFPLGMSNGIGLYIRYAAMELVPEEEKAFAMTLVLSGGCASAFLGPESGELTKDIFGDDYTYLGLYLCIVAFNILGALSVGFVSFPPMKQMEVDVEGGTGQKSAKEILKETPFVGPTLIAGLSWTLMLVPMSIARVAMKEVGFASRESLLTLELHFLSMYSPGFFSGRMIGHIGAYHSSALSIFLLLSGMVINLCVTDSTSAVWIIGLLFLGSGWNIGFSSATVLLSKTYAENPGYGPYVQAVNDFVMFGMTGCAVVSAGFIYTAGGEGISGWQLLNVVVAVGLLPFLYLVVPGLMKERQAKKQ